MSTTMPTHDDPTVQKNPSAIGASPRRAYRAPRLREFGAVRDVTRTSIAPNASPDGGGGFPFIYAS